ncbi:MAG: UvrD-helicase domain-containing protein, partial [Planctomycetota bacterium]|nr:UvrD-helicase domain-containing protein [Planctomycetota bacterium]
PRVRQEAAFLREEVYRGRMTADGWETAEAQVEGAVSALVETTRSIGKSPADLPALAEKNETDLLEILGPEIDVGDYLGPLREAIAARTAWREENAQLAYQYLAKDDRALRPVLETLEKGELPEPAAIRSIIGVGKDKRREYAELTEPIRDLATALLAGHPDERRRMLRAAGALFHLTERALSNFQEEKSSSRTIDFSDMQARALALLQLRPGDLPFVRYLQAKVRLLLVDEFQDTSPMQYQIVEALREQGRVPAFYVGDPRQAIYGWRDADSALLTGLVERAADLGANLDRLGENWRSRPELVDFGNALFGKLFDSVGMPFGRVEAKSPYATGDAPSEGPALEALVLPGKKKRDHYQAIAMRVAQILGEGCEVWDWRGARSRPLRPSDIAVIARSNSELDGVALALEEEEVKVTREQGGFHGSLEEALFSAAVAAFCNLENRRSLAALLLSEIYGISQATLVDLHDLGFFQSPRRFLMDALTPDEGNGRADLVSFRRLLDGEAAAEPSEGAAIQRLARDWDVCRRLFRRRPFDEACEQMADRLGFVPRMLAARGSQGRANAVRCLEIARRFAALEPAELESYGLGGAGPEAFLAYLGVIGEQGIDDQIPAPPAREGGGVHLRTVHGAKGLEYPIVFWISGDRDTRPRLPRTETVRPKEDIATGDILSRCRLAHFPLSISDVLNDRLMAGARDEALQDAARVLYVAFTRPRERLVLCWYDDPREDSFQELMQRLAGVSLDPGEGDATLVIGEERLPVSLREVDLDDEDDEGEGTSGGDPSLAEFLLSEETPAPRRKKAIPELWQPETVAPALARLSPTELCSFLSCPAEYEILHRKGGEYRGTSRDSGPEIQKESIAGDWTPIVVDKNRDVLGELAHLALYLADPAREGGVDGKEREKIVEAVSGRAEESFRDHVRLLLHRSISLVEAYFSQYPPAGPTLREHPVLTRTGGTLIAGLIDLAIPTEKGWEVYDYKVIEARDEREICAAAAHYKPQLLVYAASLQAATSRPVEGIHLILLEQEVVVHLGRPEPLDKLQVLLKDAAARIASESFDRNPDRHCPACPYKDVCGKAVV